MQSAPPETFGKVTGRVGTGIWILSVIPFLLFVPSLFAAGPRPNLIVTFREAYRLP